jgi:hypothetical protein
MLRLDVDVDAVLRQRCSTAGSPHCNADPLLFQRTGVDSMPARTQWH